MLREQPEVQQLQLHLQFMLLNVTEENLQHKVWNRLALPIIVTMTEKTEVCYLTTLLVSKIM